MQEEKVPAGLDLLCTYTTDFFLNIYLLLPTCSTKKLYKFIWASVCQSTTDDDLSMGTWMKKGPGTNEIKKRYLMCG